MLKYIAVHWFITYHYKSKSWSSVELGKQENTKENKNTTVIPTVLRSVFITIISFIVFQ